MLKQTYQRKLNCVVGVVMTSVCAPEIGLSEQAQDTVKRMLRKSLDANFFVEWYEYERASSLVLDDFANALAAFDMRDAKITLLENTLEAEMERHFDLDGNR